MRSKVIYEEILLLSLKEKKSKKVVFDSKKNILYGLNDTGKSTILKAIFWTLGMNPIKFFGDRLDKNIICLVKIKYNNQVFYFFRNKELRRLYNSDKELLIETESNSEFQSYLADLFKYNLSLIQRNNFEEYLVGLQGLLTPYYIDQDVGWSHKWDGPFEGMYRYFDFYQQVIEHFTGVTSDQVILLKQEQRKLLNSKKELDIKIKVYENSAKELLNFDENFSLYPAIDNKLLEKNISRSTLQIKKLQELQLEFRQNLTQLFNEKQIVINLLKNAHNLHSEAIADLEVLNNISDNSLVECPTCGTQHEKTFEANIALEFDIEGISQNIFNLNQRLGELKQQENILVEGLKKINDEIQNFKGTLEQPISKDYKFEDVIKSYSNINIQKNIDANIEIINTGINDINTKINDIKDKINEIDSPEDIKDKILVIKKAILYYYNQLNVDATEPPNRIYSKPNISGSSNPRSILALHLAYLSISYKQTSLPLFPIVIDTIQQNGQDDLNINNMIRVISLFKRPQIILGMEKLPENTEGYKVTTLNNEEYQVLNNDKYLTHLDEINSFIDIEELAEF